MSIPIRRRGLGENIALVFSLLFRNFGSLVLVSLLFSLPGLIPLILAQMYPGSWIQVDQFGVVSNAAESWSSIISFLFFPLLAGSIIGIVTGSYTGEKISIGESLGLAASKFIHLGLFGILYYLAMVLGFILLIVPGFIVLCMFYVGMPAIVAENLTFGEAFGRSAFLTKGSRMGIFGFVIVLGLISFLVMLFAMMPIGMAIGVAGSTGGGAGGLFLVLVTWVMTSLLGLLNMIAPVVIYFQTRAEKESFQLTSVADLVDRIEARRISGEPDDDSR